MLKRTIDILASSLILLVSSPVLFFLFISLYFSNNGKVFFIQQRPGLRNKPFYIYKFKTMNDARDEHGNFLPDHKRITWIGSWIRKTSLDELPQFWNVLKGEMSLVGPRPLLMKYLELYNEHQLRRHEVKPGITGWAQVNGRNAISWQQKFEFDIWYVDNRTLSLDIKILILTLKKVFKKEGVSKSETVTMPPFTGN